MIGFTLSGESVLELLAMAATSAGGLRYACFERSLSAEVRPSQVARALAEGLPEHSPKRAEALALIEAFRGR